MTNDLCYNIDKGMVNGVLFQDLKKAFDIHTVMVPKLLQFRLAYVIFNKSEFDAYVQKCPLLAQSPPLVLLVEADAFVLL